MSISSTGPEPGRARALASLRWRLALAFGLLGAALAAALSLVLGHYASDAAREQIGRYLTRLAIEYRDKLDATLAERMDDVVSLAQLDSAVPGAASPERRRARLDQLARNPDFAWIGYVTPDGRVELASGQLLEGQDVSERPWFRDGRERAVLKDAHKAVLLERLLPAAPEPRRFVDLAVPLAGGRGVVGAHVDFSWARRLRADIERSAGAQNPVELLLLQRDGEVLSGPAALVGTRMPLPRDADAPARLVQWREGDRYLVGTSISGGIGNGLTLGWLTVARQQSAIAFEPVARLQRAIFWAGLMLTLAAIAAGWLLAGRLARPLEALAEAAQKIADGAPRVSLPRLRDNREFARLADALRAMLAHLEAQAESLRDSQDRLERRVRERTAELVEVQAQLELEVADTMVARDDVAHAREQLALALEASSLALWDFDVAAGQVYLDTHWSRMLGVPAAETRTTSDALLALVPEAERARVVGAARDAVAGRINDYRVEHPIRRPDGSEIWIVSRGRVVARDAEGRALRIVGTNRDITDRVLAERARRAADLRFRLAFDNSALGMTLVEPDGRFLQVNDAFCRLVGYSREELLAMDFRRLTHPEDVEANAALQREALEARRGSYRIDKRYVRKDGSVVWARLDVTLVRDELDLPLQFLGQVQEIPAQFPSENPTLIAKEKQ